MEQKFLDFIRPKSETHAKLLQRVKAQLQESESKMSQFYNRWNMRELQYQAYVPVQDWETKYKNTCKDKQLTSVKKQDANIVVPYSFSTIRTIVTYLATVFFARKPIFTVSANDPKFTQNAKNMENLLQYNAEHAKLVQNGIQFLYNGEIYGLAVLKTAFKTETQPRTSWITDVMTGLPLRVREAQLVYQGNSAEVIDPFLFFPDPRVPMYRVNKEGEYVYWRSFVGKFILQKAGDTYAYLDDIGMMTPGDTGGSLANIRANGDSLNNQYDFKEIDKGSSFVQIDEGSVEIIPSQIGLDLGEGYDNDKPHKFIITLANKQQIIRFELYEPDHNMHPVVVCEPYAIGNGFGNMGISDYLSPFQESISWFLNSHIFNVKGVVNNSFLYDPSMIEEKDIKSDAPGKCIRIKPKAFGVEIQSYFKQIPVADTTSGHVADMQALMRLGNDLSAINDNVRGMQDSGGRKTATEIRATIEAVSSRLAFHAQYISASSFVDLGRQWCLNLQQYLSDDFQMAVLGEDGAVAPVNITPMNITGDFIFPVHDGSLPLDKVALFDIWQVALQFAAGNPQIAQTYDIPRIFEYVARLGGAENVAQFKIQPQPDAAVAQQAQQGNLVPVGSIAGGVPNDLSQLF